ncbi:MAG: CAP domain-containing protein [Myxococcota bacterium]|nr:CAP domain-containing protein [Myxococcota bacterium]
MIVIMFIACSSGNDLETGDRVESQDEDVYPHDIAEGCHPDLAGWSDPWMGIEFATLSDMNRMREAGANCNSMGIFEATAPLEMEPHLHCAARYHSLWMSENDMMHESPGGDLGEDPQQRMDNAGFTGRAGGENVAAGSPSPTDTVQSWMGSDGHCANIMNPDVNVAGIGYVNSSGGYQHYWTLNTGRID